MGYDSKILPLIVGGIKTNEEFETIQVNCFPANSATDGRSGIDVSDIKVLFPSLSDDKRVPLGGGAIVKLTISGAKINTTGSGNANLIGTYSKEINKLSSYAASKIPGVSENEFPRVSDLVDARNRINKTLISMPSILDQWHPAGVPTLMLSTNISEGDSVDSAEKLQKKMDPLIKDGTRLNGLGIVGNFKFIPINVLMNILSALVKEEGDEAAENGLGNYVGLSGLTFKEMLDMMVFNNETGALDTSGGSVNVDELIPQILMDLCPIFRVSDDAITGRRVLNDIGFYTANGDSLYVKMPDLSGRDSTGFSSNIYNITQEDEQDSENVIFTFELLNGLNYSAFAFDHTAPPCPDIIDNDLLRNSTDEQLEGDPITITKEGLDINGKYKFYLSPIFPPKKNIKVKSFDETTDALEMFTAPLLTKPYMFPSNNNFSSVIDFANPDSGLDLEADSVYERFIDHLKDSLKNIGSSVSNTGVYSTEVLQSKLSYYHAGSSSFMIIGIRAHFIKDVGLPLQVSLSKVGVKKQSDLLGELNRPEMLIGYRDGDPSASKNDMLFFNPNTTASSNILPSVTPNLLAEPTSGNQIPSTWIELSQGSVTDDDLKDTAIGLKISASDLKNYNSSASVEFALYVVDEIGGHIVRVPGENIVIYPSLSAFDTGNALKPDGFRAQNEVIDADTKINIKVNGSGMSDVISVNVYTDSLGLQGVGLLKDGEDAGENKIFFTNQTTQSITIKSNSNWNEITGNNTGTFYVGLEMGNGMVSGLETIYVAGPGTTGTELPDKTPTPVSISDPFGFKVLKFGKGLHSLPILMDGSSAQINIKSKQRKVFEEGGKLYAYLGFEKSDANKDIVDDFCFEENIQESVVDVTSGEDKALLVPLSLEYEFNSGDFYSKSKRKARFNFPGSKGAGLNLSRLTNVDSAYLIITNFKWSENRDKGILAPEFGKNYAAIPIGGQTRGGDSGVQKAFVTPPHVLGLIAELPAARGDARATSTIVKGKIDSDISEYLRPQLKAKVDQDLDDEQQRIIAADALDRLSVVFSGPDESSLGKKYKVSIGSKKLKKYRAGRIKYAGNNRIVANFFNISGIKDEGHVDIVVTKKDKRFKTTYDSTLYTRVTVDFDGTDVKEGQSSPFLSSETGTILDRKGGDKQVTQLVNAEDLSQGIDLSTCIFKPGSDPDISPLPLVSRDSSYIAGADASDSKSYFNFGSPVKITPSVTLTLGKNVTGDTSEVTRGVSLSDALIDEETGILKEDIIDITTTGRAEVQFSVEELRAQGTAILNEARSVASNIEAMGASVAGGESLLPQHAQDALDEFASQEAEFNAASSGAQADAAAAQAQQEALDASGATSGGSDPGATADAIEDAINDTAEAIEGAVDDLNNFVNSLLALTDQLSSIVQSLTSAVEDAASAFASRPSDFTKVNAKYIFLKNKANISPGSYISNENEDKWKLFLTTKIQQNAAIKFNIPEIVSVEKNNTTYTKTGENKYSKLKITEGESILIRTIGTSLDTKFEVSGKRVDGTYNPSSSGIFLDFDVEIPNLDALLIFGSNPCTKIAISNTNSNRMRLGRTVGANEAVNIDDNWAKQLFGGNRSKTGPAKDLKEKIEKFFLKFTAVKLDKANVAKEFIQSFCDFSFHLTAELSLQLRNFKVLLIPIKIIFCIIDVICALLHPIRLAFAIIRLFLCLYDLILLLPQLSVPAMALALFLHLLELLLCVITKILSIITAINELSTAMKNAIAMKNYPAIVALEEAINEHLFSLEADLEVLEPIITILALFLELLQLLFAFPCSVGADEDEENCIDASMLAGLILGKVAPNGRIEPDALIPMAQAYTTVPLQNVGSKGNTPPINEDPRALIDDGAFIGDFRATVGTNEGESPANIFRTPGEAVKSGNIFVSNISDQGGSILPGLKDSITQENKLTEVGGFFAAPITNAENGKDEIGNVDYQSLRFNGANIHEQNFQLGSDTGSVNAVSDFQATFALSFTKSTKPFSIFTGPDPRIVDFEFNARGRTSPNAFNWFLALFYSKKNINMIQTCDDPVAFLTADSGSINVASTSVDKSILDLISPIDGAGSGGSPVFIEHTGSSGEFQTFSTLPLTADIELQQPGVNSETFDAEFTPVTVTKTFGNIPMVALVDDDFNVYFIEKNGIRARKDHGVWEIASINAKMINRPSAPKKKTSREKVVVHEYDVGGLFVSDVNASDMGSSAFRAPGFGVIYESNDDSPNYPFYDDPQYLEGGANSARTVTVSDPDIFEGPFAGQRSLGFTKGNCKRKSGSDLDGGESLYDEADGAIIIKELANAIALRNYLFSEGKVDDGTGEGFTEESAGYNPSEGFTVKWPDIEDYMLQNQSSSSTDLSVSWSETPTVFTILGKDFPLPFSEDRTCTLKTTKNHAKYSDSAHASSDNNVGDGKALWEDGMSVFPYPGYHAKDWANGSGDEQRALQQAIDTVRALDFPQLYLVDMRQVADDIAAACGASMPAQLLLDLPGFERDYGDEAVTPVQSCLQDFLDFFKSEETPDASDIPKGVIPMVRYYLEKGEPWAAVPITDELIDPNGPFSTSIQAAYESLVDCINDAIDVSCEFVINPLNTSFYLNEDEDDTDLPEYVNPQQADIQEFAQINEDFDLDMSGLPQVTGAMEYASGIGDTVTLEAAKKCFITIIPRDSYDDSDTFDTMDVSDRIRISFIEDETETGATLVPVEEGSDELVVKDGSTYTLAVLAETPGKVVIKATICGVAIQAVTERGLKDTSAEFGSEVDCVDDDVESTEDGEVFAPGSLMKVDRLLTILFTKRTSAGAGGRYGDDERDQSARSSKPSPQTFGTKLEN